MSTPAPCRWCGNTATMEKDGIWSCGKCGVFVGPRPAPAPSECCNGTCATEGCGRHHIKALAPNGKHVVYCESCRLAYLRGIQDGSREVAALREELAAIKEYHQPCVDNAMLIVRAEKAEARVAALETALNRTIDYIERHQAGFSDCDGPTAAFVVETARAALAQYPPCPIDEREDHPQGHECGLDRPVPTGGIPSLRNAKGHECTCAYPDYGMGPMHETGCGGDVDPNRPTGGNGGGTPSGDGGGRGSRGGESAHAADPPSPPPEPVGRCPDGWHVWRCRCGSTHGSERIRPSEDVPSPPKRKGGAR